MSTILIRNLKVTVHICSILHKFRKPKLFENQTALLHQQNSPKENDVGRKTGEIDNCKLQTQTLKSAVSKNRPILVKESSSDIRKPVFDIFMSTKAQNFSGLPDTQVYTLKTEQQVREGIQLLRAHIKNQPEKVVGFDTETRIKPGCDINRVSVIQLAIRELCLVIYIHRIVNEGLVFPHSLQLFLQDNDIMKVGVCAHRDAWAVNDSYNVKCANVLDLKYMAIKLGHRNTTLKSLANKYGNMKLNKQLHYKRWSKRELRKKDIIYAAQDAVASYVVYFGMKRLGDSQTILPDGASVGSRNVK